MIELSEKKNCADTDLSLNSSLDYHLAVICTAKSDMLVRLANTKNEPRSANTKGAHRA